MKSVGGRRRRRARSGTRRRPSTSPTPTRWSGRTTTSPCPPGSQLLDFELEVAVVVGQDGASLTPELAREHVFGYTILNDWSARDLQRREMKVNLGPAKGKDSATTLGPWLVTADELEPYRDADGFLALDMRVSVNGVEIGQDLLSNMGWPFEELISYASRGTEVRAGDVLGSGHLRQRRLPGRAVGTARRALPSPAAARRRRGDDRRGHRHHPQPRRPGPGPAAGPCRPARGRGTGSACSEPGRGQGRRRHRRRAGAGRRRGAAAGRRGRDRRSAVDLKPEPAEELPGVEYRQLDVTDAAGWAALAADLGRVDGLVANAGITWRARLADLDPADLARVHEVNVTGTLLGIQALTPADGATAARSSSSGRSPR